MPECPPARGLAWEGQEGSRVDEREEGGGKARAVVTGLYYIAAAMPPRGSDEDADGIEQGFSSHHKRG